jgi:hypothetical protein
LTKFSKDVLNRKIFFSVGGRKVRERSLTLSVFSDLNLDHLSAGRGVEENKSLVFEMVKPGFYFSFILQKM